MKHFYKRILTTLCVVPVAYSLSASAQIASPAPSPSASLVPTTTGNLTPTTDSSVVPTAPGATPPSSVPLVPPNAAATPDAAAPAAPAPIEPPVQDVSPSVSAPASIPGSTAPAPATLTNISSLAATNDGHPITEFQDQEVATAIRLLARQAKISISISDKITPSDRVTIRLEDKTPLEAIGIICNTKSLYLVNIDKVYYVKTMDEKGKEPTSSEFYTFSYAQAKDMVPLLASQFPEATPQVDNRTNTVFYRITKSNAESAKLFLSTVDKPTQQVMIEARLVEVTANPRQSYGINWAGVVGSAASGQTVRYAGTTTATSSINLQTNPQTGQVTPTVVQSSLPGVTLSNGTLQGNDFLLNGSKGVGGLLNAASGQLAILSVPQMSLTLRMLNEDSDAEFLANPRIVTANNEKATIKITRNQPVPQLNFNEQTATAVFGGFEDKTYGNTLEVLPSINKDNYVTLGVKPTISNKVADATFTFSGATVASPVIDTRTLDSNVLIKSGNTLAIGGLLQDEVTKGRTKVPVLGDIPVLGYLFQERLNSRVKRNLLVFVTPTIIKEGYGTGLEDQVSGLHDSGEEYADPNGWRNNAKGAVRVAPTSNRQVVADYPAPGTPLQPVNYRASAASRAQ